MLVLQIGSETVRRYGGDASVLRQNGMLCERVDSLEQALELLKL